MGPAVGLAKSASTAVQATIIVFGEIMVGCGAAFAFVPTLPLMLESVNIEGDITGPVSGAIPSPSPSI